MQFTLKKKEAKTTKNKWHPAVSNIPHLTTLHQLLVSSCVLVGGGSVLSSGDCLCGCSCSLLGSILRNNDKTHTNVTCRIWFRSHGVTLSSLLCFWMLKW